MLGDLMGKMQDAQKQMEEAKKRLNDVFVDGTAENGLVKVTSTATKKITNISISNDIVGDKEALEDLIIVAVNKALEEADKVHEAEMGGLAQGMMPDLFG